MAILTASETAVLRQWHALRQEEDGVTWVQFGDLPRFHAIPFNHELDRRLEDPNLAKYSPELAHANHGRFSVWKMGGVFCGGTYVPVSFHLTDESKNVVVEAIGGGRSQWRGRLKFLKNLCAALASVFPAHHAPADPVEIEMHFDSDPVVMGKLVEGFGRLDHVHFIRVDWLDGRQRLTVNMSPSRASERLRVAD